MIYDITLPISPRLARWPGDPAVETHTFGEDVKVSRWVLGSHAGTHVDAQAHYSAGPQTADQLDPSILLGPCRVLHLPNADLITADALAPFDLQHVTRILLRTRNSAQWDAHPSEFDESFVGLRVDAAEYLRDLGIKLIGVDGLSVEPYAGNGEVHQTLLRASIVLLEGVSLSQVPPGDYQLVCAPLKLLGADGAPARVFLVG